jgi:RsiW-degrading membrane proteinase PrsW (M82 family)
VTESRRPGFFEVRSLVFWMTIALMAIGAYWRFSSMFDLWGDYRGGIVASIVVWVVYGVIVAWLIFRLQRFERRPVSATVAAVAWGLFVAGGVVALVGQDLQSLTDKLMGFETSREWGPAFRAPLVEETMKSLGVVALALIPRVRLVRVIDGVYYGMLSGLGFIVSENIFFSNEAIAGAGGEGVGTEILGVMMVRGIASLPLSHVAFSAIAGAGVGYVMSRRGRSLGGRLLVAFGFYATAFALHGFQNSPFLDDVAGNLFIKGLPALAVFLIVLRWGRSEYRSDLRRLADTLGPISGEDVDALATRHRRKKAAEATDDPNAAGVVQRARIDLLVAADRYGADSPLVRNAAAALDHDGS